MQQLPPFRLEAYFSRWEFVVRHHLTASDPETLTIDELLAYATEDQRQRFGELGLGYVPTWGGEELREAVAGSYDASIRDRNVLTFAGAEEALYWLMQLELGPGDHAVVTVPNYQSMESVALRSGAEITGLPLWNGTGSPQRWSLDVQRLRDSLRPYTRLVAVNFPNNPTGFVPEIDDFHALVSLCDERGIRLISDEVYRGVEQDQSRTLPQAAELSERAVSVNVLSKAYGMPGLRIGWVACRDDALLARLERSKHYTTICNAGPSEALATIALRNADALRDRIRSIVAANLPVFDEFFAEFSDLFEYAPPDGGCVVFPRYRGPEGVEAFCTELVRRHGVLLLPASIFRSDLARTPHDRFRLGLGRRNPEPGLDEIRRYLTARAAPAGT